MQCGFTSGPDTNSGQLASRQWLVAGRGRRASGTHILQPLEADFCVQEVEPRGSDGHRLQVVEEDCDILQQLLDEDSPLRVVGLLPQRIDVEVAQDGDHLVEAQLRVALEALLMALVDSTTWTFNWRIVSASLSCSVDRSGLAGSPSSE